MPKKGDLYRFDADAVSTVGRNTTISNLNFEDNKVKSSKRMVSSVFCHIDNPKVTVMDLQKLMEAGVNVITMDKFNFTTHDIVKMLEKLKEAAQFCCKKNDVEDWPIATCIELKTCITRTGFLEGGKDKVFLKKGTEVILTCNKEHINACSENQIYVDSLYLTKNVLPGNSVSLRGNEIIVKCIEYIDVFTVKCVVVKEGELVNLCILNLKGANYHEPLLMKKDYEILEFAIENKIDSIMVNFPRDVNCLKEIKKWLKDKDHKPLIITGVASISGVADFENIVKEADAVLIPRDLLEFELDSAHKDHMPRLQTWMTGHCQKIGKQFFVTGGVFDVAVATGTPTNSELFDIANALLDGASGFMLKKCINMDNTLQAVIALEKICRMIEPMITTTDLFWEVVDLKEVPVNAAQAAATSCIASALVSQAKVIIIPTVSGTTIKLLLSLRPSCTVITVSTSENVKKQLTIFGHVIPLVYRGSSSKLSFQQSVKARREFAVEFAVKKSLMMYGDKYVSLERYNDTSAFCDTVYIWKVELIIKSSIECPSDPMYYQTENYLELIPPNTEQLTFCLAEPARDILTVTKKRKKKPISRVTLIDHREP